MGAGVAGGARVRVGSWLVVDDGSAIGDDAVLHDGAVLVGGGGLGLQQLTRSCSERFGLGAAQFVLKLKQTAGQRGSLNLPVRFMHGSSGGGG